MKLTQLAEQKATLKTILYLATAMLAMLYFGFQLAGLERDYMAEEHSRMETSVANLNQDNNRLLRSNSELEVQLDIAEMKVENLTEELQQANDAIAKLQRDEAFYRHVMAPEDTQDGFLIDGLQIKQSVEQGAFFATMVVLQQRQVKAPVSGELLVSLSGSMNGDPVTLSLNKETALTPEKVEYGFKYYQPIDFMFTLPVGFVPDTIEFSTTVYQYKRKRGDYQRQFSWQDIFDDKAESPL